MTYTCLFQDDDIIVVEKPSLLLSVPGRGPDKIDSLSYRIQQKLPHALIVHRLDWETSGVMVFALTKDAQRHLNKQFMLRQVHKEYECRVFGKLSEQGEINIPIMPDWKRRPKQMVQFIQGKPSQTLWQTMQHEILTDKESSIDYDVSRVKLFPITGRSHQLRIHMQHIGHSILGDPLYVEAIVSTLSNRLQLHATKLSFFHPISEKRVTFESDCPF